MANSPAGTESLALVTRTSDEETRIHVQRVIDGRATEIDSIPVRTPAPELPVSPGSVTQLRALDILESVLDEEAWLAAISTVLAPGGTALFRVPLEGPVAWLDALNLYRYAQDISGTGKHLEETKLKGWHRHYRPAELGRLLTEHGLDVTAVDREGNPLIEAAQFGALVWGGMIRHSAETEGRIRRWRERNEDHHRLTWLGPFSTRITVTVQKRA